MKTIVITQHQALIDFLKEINLISEDFEVISHASPEEIRGNHVIGILPLHLAVEAEKVTTVPLNIPKELRGQELSLDQIREFAGNPRTFIVKEEV